MESTTVEHINWVQVILSAGILYALIKFEQWYRMWRYRRSRKNVPKLAASGTLKGLVSGSANAVPCGRCGVLVNKFYEYTDGSCCCVRCQDEEKVGGALSQ